jgi:ubiquinone/menaquinone biosynthesis C-methylase UbiE
VIGEIPRPARAVREIRRVLKPGGTLALSELLMDPDYSPAGTLVRLVLPEGFRLQEWRGNAFYYTLVFEKVGATSIL